MKIISFKIPFEVLHFQKMSPNFVSLSLKRNFIIRPETILDSEGRNSANQPRLTAI